ncbi:MAG: SUMF1/EgtB/PvdO family nonheme iron enzyme [Planctomycetes bacterium]|nr:SUMF1/EgtB/PvdO family nonheme iron enzyme [Planctomycetota bacterium]
MLRLLLLNIVLILTYNLHGAVWSNPIPAWSDSILEPEVTAETIDAPLWDDNYNVWFTYIKRSISKDESDVKMIYIKANHVFGGPTPIPADYKNMPTSFIMGSPVDELHRQEFETQHLVNVSAAINNGMWVSETECKQEFWKTITNGGIPPAPPALLGADPTHFINLAMNHADYVDLSVNKVPYEDLNPLILDIKNDFLAALSTSLSGDSARVPTEEEWEYFARANTNTMYNTKIGTELNGSVVNVTIGNAVLTKTVLSVGVWDEESSPQVNFEIYQDCVSSVEIPFEQDVVQTSGSLDRVHSSEANFNTKLRDRFIRNDYGQLIPVYHNYVVDSINGGYESVDEYEKDKYRKRDGSVFTGTSTLFIKVWQGPHVVYQTYASVNNIRHFAYKAGPGIEGIGFLDNDNYAFQKHVDGDILSSTDRFANKVFIEKYVYDTNQRVNEFGVPDANGQYVATVGISGMHLVTAYYKNGLLGNRLLKTSRFAHQMHDTDGAYSTGLVDTAAGGTNTLDYENTQISNGDGTTSSIIEDMDAELENQKTIAYATMRNDWGKLTPGGPINNHTATKYNWALGLWGSFIYIKETNISGANYNDIYADGGNQWGLLDIHGGVNEYTSDTWDGLADYGETPVNNSLHVTRGGSWADTSPNCRAAARHAVDPNIGNVYTGFRFIIE